MRKQYKLKKRSCAMRKPHKMGWENRWSFRDKVRNIATQQELKDVQNKTDKSQQI